MKKQTRLQPFEQTSDKKKTAGFGTAKAHYMPYSNLTVSQIKELIMATVWAETCVQTIVDEVIKYPIICDNEDATISAFLKFPSEKEPLMSIRKKYLKDMLRFGNGAVVIQKKGQKPYQLVAVPGYSLRVTDDNPPKYKFLKVDEGGVSSSVFLQDKKGNDVTFDIDEVMHFQIDAESDSTLAPAPLARVYNEVLTDKYIGQRLTQFIQKGFYKPSFLSLPGINKKDLEEFVELLNASLSEDSKMYGINKEGTCTAIPFMDAKDVVELDRWMGLKIAAVYKVPPFMVNLIQDTGSLNAREQKARFLENVVLPILEYESYIYTVVLARLAFKNEAVEITSPLIGTKLNYDRARIARLLVGNADSIISVDEARKSLFNLPPMGTASTSTKKTQK